MTTPENVDFDITVPHPARIYDYLLGGEDNYPADRQAAEAAAAVTPDVRSGARANRAFLGRAVRYAAEQGVDQFLDLGTGIPGPGNTGVVARAVNPRARVAYVDFDPLVAARSRALLAEGDPELSAVVQADVRDPHSILGDAAVRAVVDFERPVAVVMAAVLHFVADAEDPVGIVKEFADAVPGGSMLLLSHATFGPALDQAQEVAKNWQNATARLSLRTVEGVRALLAGWELVEPGFVPVPYWRPDGELPEDADRIHIYGAVGIKP